MSDTRDAKNKKIQILEALNQCLQDKPFAKTSIKDIARTAGVNHGLLHYYFKSKEDILIRYIEYVIDHYKSLFVGWLENQQPRNIGQRQLIEDFFGFMSSRITMDRKLSKVFIEIWEIAAYNPDVKAILQKAYREWIDTLAQMLDNRINNPVIARQISAATVAFLEGMALFSIILPADTFDFNQVLSGFQKQIIDSL